MASKERPPIPTRVRILLLALFLARFAAAGLVTILGKQVFDMTGRVFDLGLLGLAEFIPVAILAPISGSVADAYDRRFVYALGLTGEVLVSLGLFVYVATNPTALWPILVLAMGLGVSRAFVAPSSRALPIDMAPRGLVERVVAVRSLVFQAGTISGPVVFAFVFVRGISLPYLVAALSFGLAIVSVFFIGESTVRRSAKITGYSEALVHATQGLRFMRSSPVVAGAIVLDLFAVLLGGAVALLPAIAEERLGVGAIGLGWLRATLGIGGAAGAFAMSIRPVTRQVGKVLLTVIAVFGAAHIALGLTTSFAVAIGALFVASASDSISVYIRATLVPLATPEEMRGRVLAVENVFIGASNELGAVESGLAGQWLGVAPAVIAGGIGTILVAAVFWFAVPALKNVDRFPRPV